MSDAPKPGAAERAIARERAARKRAEQLLESKSSELYAAQQQLQSAYSATVEVFANIVGGRSGRTSEDMRALGRDAMALARKLGLKSAATQDVYLAFLLCELGKLALPDELFESPYVKLSKRKRDHFHTHPQLAYEALMALPPLENVAEIILWHCEHSNGKGYPNRRDWSQMPTEAKIVAVIKDFDALQRGALLDGCLTDNEALQFLQTHKDDRYSSDIVSAFIEYHQSKVLDTTADVEQRLTPQSLVPGMILTRDLLNDNGVLILPAGRLLDETTIGKLQRLVTETGRDLLVYTIPDAQSRNQLPADSATTDDTTPK